MTKFGTENASFVFFGHEFGNNLAIFEICNLKFFSLQDFMKKQKCLNFRFKMTYLRIFDKKCLIWVFGYLFIWVMPYLNSAPSNLYICTILWKNKNA